MAGSYLPVAPDRRAAGDGVQAECHEKIASKALPDMNGRSYFVHSAASSDSAAHHRKNTIVKAMRGTIPAGTHMRIPPRRWSSMGVALAVGYSTTSAPVIIAATTVIGIPKANK